MLILFDDITAQPAFIGCSSRVWDFPTSILQRKKCFCIDENIACRCRRCKAERDSSTTDSYSSPSKGNEFITTFKQDIQGHKKGLNKEEKQNLKDAVKPPADSPATTKLVYTVEEIARMLAISLRSAYNLCNSTTEFRVLRVGGSIRAKTAH